MNASILLVGRSGDKLQITVSDPGRSVTKIPGIVKVKNLQFNGIMKITDANNIRTKLGRATQIRGYARLADLDRIIIDNPLTDAETTNLLANFSTADLERVGATTTPTPIPDPTDTDTIDWNTPPPATEGGFQFTMMHGALLLVALLAIWYFYFKK